MYTSAYLTVDDGVTDRATFNPHPDLVNYDQTMIVGGEANFFKVNLILFIQNQLLQKTTS